MKNWAGDFYVAGWTRSTDFPVVNFLQDAAAGGEDGLFVVLDSKGVVQHSSYYEGSTDDRILAAVLLSATASGRVAGRTTSDYLPERQSSATRGARSDGFIADIGADILIGPDERIVPKDGLAHFSLRGGRKGGIAITYRSSDPSRLRFSHYGRNPHDVTMTAGVNVSVEALSDKGEVEVIATAPGFLPKTIRVRLYPGAFVPNAPSSIRTWSDPYRLSVDYRAIDPATGEPLPGGFALSPGLGAPQARWSISDSSMLEILEVNGAAHLRALKKGQAHLTLSMDGHRVVNAEVAISVFAPEIQTKPNFSIGLDLQTQIPFWFTFDGSTTYSTPRGLLTIRSGDPSRLLLTTDLWRAGRERVTIALSDRTFSPYAQALAGEGQVQVFFPRPNSKARSR